MDVTLLILHTLTDLIILSNKQKHAQSAGVMIQKVVYIVIIGLEKLGMSAEIQTQFSRL
jgi:hypothetical protein